MKVLSYLFSYVPHLVFFKSILSFCSIHKINKKILLFFLFLSPPSFASLSIEPYIGGNIIYYQANNSILYFGFPSIGTRIGYSVLNMMLGLDLSYNYISPSSFPESTELDKNCNKQTNATTGYLGMGPEVICGGKKGINYHPYHLIEIGPSVSISLPIVFDFYGSLFYAHARSDPLSLDGIGLKAGMSYLSLPFVSLNAEIQITHFLSCSVPNGSNCPEQSNYPKNLFKALAILSFPINTGFF